MNASPASYTHACARIEGILSRDPGCRGISALVCPGDLAAAALAFAGSDGVLILTGFPCLMNSSPPTETDGPSGALALARAAIALGKRAAIATDDCNANVLCAIAGGAIPLYAFPPRGTGAWSVGGGDRTRLLSLACAFPHTIAVERAGACQDGVSYRTMRNLEMRHLVAPLDELLTLCCAPTPAPRAAPGAVAFIDAGVGESALPLTPTSGGLGLTSAELSAVCVRSGCTLGGRHNRSSTGIGDGGNEGGMGRVLERVIAHIKGGADIACGTPAGSLIAAGVSNWGGWGLCAALEIALRTGVASVACPVDGRVHAAAAAASLAHLPLCCLLPTDAGEIALASALADAGARDGISGALVPHSVDGMPVAGVHLSLLEELRAEVRRAVAEAAVGDG